MFPSQHLYLLTIFMLLPYLAIFYLRNFTSPVTVRIEAGLAGAEAQYRQNVKAQRLIGDIRSSQGHEQPAAPFLASDSSSVSSHMSIASTSLAPEERINTTQQSVSHQHRGIFDPQNFIAKENSASLKKVSELSTAVPIEDES